MRCRPVAALALLCCGAVAAVSPVLPGRAEDVPLITRVVRLRFAKPSEVAPKLGATKEVSVESATGAESGSSAFPAELPPGVVAIGASDREGTLTLRGPAAEVENTEKLVVLLDVPERPVTLRVRLLRVPSADGGEEDATALTGAPTPGASTPGASVVAKAVFRTTSSGEAKATLVERGNGDTWGVCLKPKVNGDGTVRVTYMVSRSHRLGTPDATPRVRRVYQEALNSVSVRVRPGTPLRLQAFEATEEGAKEKGFARYVLEVTPTLPSPGAGKMAPGVGTTRR